ncbi:GFA family protein [Azospirillum sp. ST 5-10]|uniref:GFA family protein n=1 Tax=unclassified Azospirillum TaxID=2630922 RepID=UPI003F4A194E
MGITDPANHPAAGPPRSGGCACGAVRVEALGEPRRVGLCHCATCRKRHGTPFNAFAVFARDQVRIVGGPVAVYRSSERGRRHFCQACGSPVFYREEGTDEIELFLGSLDDADAWAPTYEAWDRRRAGWLPALPSVLCRYAENRTGSQPTEP